MSFFLPTCDKKFFFNASSFCHCQNFPNDYLLNFFLPPPLVIIIIRCIMYSILKLTHLRHIKLNDLLEREKKSSVCLELNQSLQNDDGNKHVWWENFSSVFFFKKIHILLSSTQFTFNIYEGKIFKFQNTAREFINQKF